MLIQPAGSITLLEYIQIWCNIQVITHIDCVYTTFKYSILKISPTCIVVSQVICNKSKNKEYYVSFLLHIESALL